MIPWSQILGELGKALGILQTILGFSSQAAIESFPLQIVGIDNAIAARLDNPTYGLAALLAKVDLSITNAAAYQSALLTAIAAAQQGGSPVTLPTTPPAGYGGLDATATGNAVWDVIPPSDTFHMGDYQRAMGRFAQHVSDARGEYRSNVVGIMISGEWEAIQPGPFGDIVDPDPTTILGTDANPTAWANRVYSSFSWSPDQFGRAQMVTSGAGGVWIYTIPIDVQEFAEWKALLGFGPTSTEAPVWPGLSKVTLGASHALATGLTIAGAMDGVIVTITSVPPGTGSYDFNGTLSYTFVGALSFYNDNGDQEFPQGLGFQTAVYSPKEMTKAAGVKVRTKPGIVGTVTPWSIT